jgi:hypothetical protein
MTHAYITIRISDIVRRIFHSLIGVLPSSSDYGPGELDCLGRVASEVARVRANHNGMCEPNVRYETRTPKASAKRYPKWGGLTLTYCGELVRVTSGLRGSPANELYRLMLIKELICLYGGVLRHAKAKSDN